MKSTIFSAVIMIAVLAVAGCGDDDNGGTSSARPGPLVRVVVTPALAAVPVGTSRAFTAHGEDAAGRSIQIDPVWSVPTTHLGRIDQDGHFTANCIPAVGSVKATVAGKFSGTSTVTLTPTSGTVATLAIDPDTLTMEAAGALGGERVQFYLLAKNASGVPVAVVPGWEIVPSQIGVMRTEYGFFESQQAGNGTVSATVGDLRATAIVHVAAR